MVIDREYKFSAFGSYADIVPNNENITFFLSTFNEKYNLVPSVVQEFQVSGNNQTFVSHRICLLNNDGLLQIVIGSNRIDFVFSHTTDDLFTGEDKERIRNIVVDILSVILDHFGKASNRLALATRSLLADLSGDEIVSFLGKYGNPISLYSEKEMKEWSEHLMVRRQIEINARPETLNVITNLTFAQLTKQLEDRTAQYPGFIVDLDINTVGENAVARFAGKDSGEFLGHAFELADMILGEVGV